jgi:hypothetical protein
MEKMLREARVAKVSIGGAGGWHDMTPEQFHARLAKARKWWGDQQSEWWKAATEAQITKASETYWALEDVGYILEKWDIRQFDNSTIPRIIPGMEVTWNRIKGT